MSFKNITTTELLSPNYVPVVKDSKTFYGGSQMWFPADHRSSRDYILHNYGCGTIATADLFLYLALQNENMRTPETRKALNDAAQVNYENYYSYIRNINKKYTKTKRIIAVPGTKIASAVNAYSKSYGLGYQAFWKLKLTYYDMLELMEEMLSKDIPVILSIGPNTPNIFGKKGIPFYEIREIEYHESNNTSKDLAAVSGGNNSTGSEKSGKVKLPYYYKAVQQDVNSHYVMVTGIIKDDVASRIMLHISSWGKPYYMNYEEYRDYIESYSGTFTSSIVYIKKISY